MRSSSKLVAVLSTIALATLAGTSVGSAGAASAPAPGDDYGQVWHILPPGSSGRSGRA